MLVTLMEKLTGNRERAIMATRYLIGTVVIIAALQLIPQPIPSWLNWLAYPLGITMTLFSYAIIRWIIVIILLLEALNKFGWGRMS